MGPGYFVIAILGCADGGAQCTQLTTLQTRYASSAECSAATVAALEQNSSFDFPTLVARCTPGIARAASATSRDKGPEPANARRG